MKPDSHLFYKLRATYFLPSYAQTCKLILLIGLLSISLRLFAFGQDKADYRLISFRGAELYTERKEAGKVTVFLKKFYDRNHEPATDVENVSLFESGTRQVKAPVALKQISKTTLENKYLQTPGDPEAGGLTVMIYSAEIALGPGYADYYITWGYHFGNTQFLNTDNSKTKGISLSLHVSNDGYLIENSTANLATLPAFIFSGSREISNHIVFEDKEKDVVSAAISAPFSLEPVQTPLAVINDGIIKEEGESSVLTERYPFKEVTYNSGFDTKNPLEARKFSLNPETGEFICQPGNKPGKYLTAINISEKRDNKKISEHQCVFVIDVK